ncbi:retrotransposon protein, putative, ty1-copia subclass [Tanacetum coccineum]
MKDNQDWCVVDLPPNGKSVRSKWIFKKNTNMDGKIYIYKAYLVTKGFTQTYGVHYEETFPPVVYIRAIRILIAISVFYDYEIWKMDVKTVFLNGYLDEDINMVQPKGFVDPKHPKKACKLQRSIYGLKWQSALASFEHVGQRYKIARWQRQQNKQGIRFKDLELKDKVERQ